MKHLPPLRPLLPLQAIAAAALLLCLCGPTLQAQPTYRSVLDTLAQVYSRPVQPLPLADTACPTVKYLRVNVHFMLETDGTGNFTETDDGRGGPYNAYRYADDMIRAANIQLFSNPPMDTFPGGPGAKPPANLPKRYAYLLTGVYFHRDSKLYDVHSRDNSFFNVAPFQTYKRNEQTELNVFMMEDTTAKFLTQTGAALGSNWVKLLNAWRLHNYDSTRFYQWYLAQLLNHELGHSFGLSHTGPVTGDINYSASTDNCPDTPPITVWQSRNTSNNMMDYHGCECALTPCQLRQLHQNLNRSFRPYIHACSGCPPASAFFALPARVCPGQPITLDARGSTNEQYYTLEIFETDSLGSLRTTGNRFRSPTYTGTAATQDLRSLFTFEPDRWYGIRLITGNCCTPTAEAIQWIRTDCRLHADLLRPATAAPRSTPGKFPLNRKLKINSTPKPVERGKKGG